MKYHILFVLFLLPMISFSQGISFEKGTTWEEALAKAEKSDKLIFLDAYATWCGPCKMLDRSVFPDEALGEYFNENFINVKMDMERGEGRDLARQFRIRAYPTLLFVNSKGEIVHQFMGYTPAENLIKVGEKALRKKK